MNTAYQVFVRNRLGKRVEMVNDFSSLSMTLNYNKAGKWTLILAAGTDAARALEEEQSGIIVTKNGKTVMSGLKRKMKRDWDRSKDTLEINGVDDLGWLENRTLYPDPAGPPFNTEYDTRVGAAESVIKAYIQHNFGLLARTERRIPGLLVERDYGRGNTVRGDARFHSAPAFLEGLALIGEIGYRIVDMVFETYIPKKNQSVLFGADWGNLSAFSYAVEAPKANCVIARGKGSGKAAYAEAADSDSIRRWGRIEMFVNESSTASEEKLLQKANETLAKNGERISLTITPNEFGYAFGEDYDIGDIVRVDLDSGSVEGQVQQATITINQSGETVKPVIGTSGEQGAVLELFAKMDDLDG